MLWVDDCSRYNFIHFLKSQSGATERWQDVIDGDITPESLNMGIIRMDCGVAFDGQFQSLLSQCRIKRESIPPYTPQYNGVAERALGL